MFKSFIKTGTFIFLFLSASSSFGQKDIYFQLNQYLGNVPFSIGDSGTNNLGTKFQITRLDYYISSIILHHDGGIVTKVPNKYIFVSKGKKVDELLGSFNITYLDSITFSIGVEYTDNHSDPNLWPSSHPLAPKYPDMQWGWAAGYRFVAIEGNSGANLQYEYQIHGLGDELYNPTTIVTNGLVQNGAIKIGIDADYERGFKEININKYVVVHGSSKEAFSLLENFNQQVFKATQLVSAAHDIEIGTLKVFPNPLTDGKLTIALSEEQVNKAQIIIRDAIGRIVHQDVNPNATNEIMIEQSGFYTIELLQSGVLTYRSKLVKQ